MELRKATHARQRNIRLPISEEFAVEKDMKITLDGAALHTMHGDAERPGVDVVRVGNCA